MNTNPQAITVLCYGDSNTYGQKPDKTGRYEVNIRWTGLLQQLLGDGYSVIEEGLGSRTTDLEYDKKPGRNGKTYLAPALHSHNPIDIVIIMLGTNDLKTQYGRSAQDVATALGGLVDDVRQYGATKTGEEPKVILISPIEINDQAPRFAEFYTGYYDEESMRESKQLSEAINEVASQKGVEFLDAATVSRAGEDGLHFEEASEQPLAELVSESVRHLS
ncbi:MAG: GDSL-type esterase/lipase family protein [Candidatus Saccharimonadales bacterium]